MCEPLLPIDELRNIQFSVVALVETVMNKPGSYEHEVARLAANQIKRRLQWVIANLEAAKEGRKNFGLEKY